MEAELRLDYLINTWPKIYGKRNHPERLKFISNLNREYIEGEYSYKELRDLIGISQANLSKCFKLHELERRSPSHKASTTGPAKRIYSLDNKQYFECINSNEKAYFLGILFTDGNVSGNRNVRYDGTRLRVARRDIDLLARLKCALGTEAPIIETVVGKKKHLSAELNIYCKELAEDLISHGVKPNRARNNTPPPRMDSKFEHAFWLGCVDGDGWIQKDKKTVKMLSGWEVGLCGNRSTVERFKRYVKSQTGITMRLKPNGSSKINYKVIVTGPESLTLISCLYGGMTRALDRKHRIVEPLIHEFKRLMSSGGTLRIDSLGRKYFVYPRNWVQQPYQTDVGVSTTKKP